MHIAINASLLDSVPSGLGVYSTHVILDLARLIETRHQLTVYTTFPGLWKQHGTLVDDLVPLPTRLQPQFGPKAAVARFLWTQFRLPFLLKGCDLLYSPTHHGPLWSDVRQVLTIHDLLPIRYPDQYRLQHYYFRTVVPRLLSQAVAVIADSESTKLDIHEYYKVPLSKIHVVYSGIEEDLRPLPEPIRNRVLHRYGLTEYVLLVGASFPHKNVERAIQAWAAVSETLPGLKFVIAGGRAQYLEKLRQTVAGSKTNGVEFLGYVPREDLIALYSGARALVYPSLYEGFGLPPLEAMACGCPAIVSNTSSLPEVCGDAAYYVDPSSPDAIAEAILKVATDEPMRTVLKKKGLAQAARFNWVTTAQSVYKVLESAGMGQ